MTWKQLLADRRVVAEFETVVLEWMARTHPSLT